VRCRLQDRQHAADLAKSHPSAQYPDNALSKARFEFRCEDVLNLSLDPVTAGNSMTKRFPRRAQKRRTSARFGPHLCSMKITEDVRKYAAEKAFPKPRP
jgi:phosphomethylpyrimidine synthase